MESLFSVTTPVTNPSLLTLAELREAVGAQDGSQDAALLRLGRRVSAAIARACGIASDGVYPPTLLRETCTESFRLQGDLDNLRLLRRPVTSITSVTSDGTAVDAANYELNVRHGSLAYLLSGDVSGWPVEVTTVVYVAGYATAPDDLKEAAMRMITAFSSDLGRDPDLKRVSIPGVMEKEYWVAPSDDPLLSAEIRDLLAPYVQFWI